MQRHTKIVATIGPASRDPKTLERMVAAGMDVARLNFSHGTAEQHAETAQRVRNAAGRVGRAVAILQDLPGPKLRIGALRDDHVDLKPGDRVVFACGEDGIGTATRMSVARPELIGAMKPGDVMYLADGSVRLRVRDVRADDARARGGGRGRRRRRVAPGPEHPRPARGAADGARGGPRAPRGRREDRRRPRRAVVRALARGHRLPARAHPPAAHREDREAAGRRARRGDHPRRRLRHGRARRPRHRAADRARADRPEGAARLRGAARAPVDHRDADARLDGRLHAPDARRGGRRRQRDPRRHRRGDALPGDGDRRLPGRGDRDDGLDRGDDRDRRAVPPLERAPRAPRRARSVLHRRLLGLHGRPRARARRDRRPDAVGPLGAPRLRPPPDRPDLRALTGAGDGPPLRPHVGRARRVPAQALGHRGAAARRLPARRRARLVLARDARRGDRRAAQRRARARPRCFRSRSSRSGRAAPPLRGRARCAAARRRSPP